MGHHTQSCRGSCPCDTIMEECSPCLPTGKNVGVRDWETCLVWNPSTLTSWFWQFRVLGIRPSLRKVRQTMKTGSPRSPVWRRQLSDSAVLNPWGHPQVYLFPLRHSAAKCWSLLSLRSQPDGPTAFLFVKDSLFQLVTNSHFQSNSTFPQKHSSDLHPQALQTVFSPEAAKPKGIGQARWWHLLLYV